MRVIGWALAVIILGASVWASIYVGLNSWRIFVAVVDGAKTLQPEIYVPLVVTLTTASIGLAAALISQARIRKREIEAAYRERKVEIYLEFLEAFEALQLAQKPELDLPEIDQNELVIKLVKIRTKATLWGSSGVLKALSEFTKVGSENPVKMLTAIDKVQREMRKDLGLSTWSLEKDFFIKLIMNSDEEFEKLRNGLA